MSEKHQYDAKTDVADGDQNSIKRHILRAPLATTQPINSGSHSPVGFGNRAAITCQQRFEMIASAAYLRAATHDFAAGQELDDWLAAEKTVDLMLASGELTKPKGCL